MTAPADLCASCSVPMPERGPDSPVVRRCETCWWAHETQVWQSGGEPHALARPVLERRFPR